MNKKKPNTNDEYKEWLKNEHKCNITNITKSHYESTTNNIKRDFEQSKFWIQLLKNIEEYNSQYLTEKKYDLFTSTSIKPEIYVKPFESFFQKTFRKNVKENKNWPDAPETGWILPYEWYSKVSDIIRTSFVVKYLDGIDFLIKKIEELCISCSLSPLKPFYEAREKGYYAVHCYTKQEFEIKKITWETERKNISIEMQIRTQLQDVIRSLLHKYYEKEKEREKITNEEIKWQWNYESNEFFVNYMGHILHYIEGMVMEIREKRIKEIL